MAVGKINSETIHDVAGVRLAAVKSQIRYPDRLDLVLIELPREATTAGVFTQNAFCAAPVNIARQHLGKARSRYFLINTGNANAGTGEAGAVAALRCCQAVANIAEVDLHQVLPFSTGVIGEELPVDKILIGVPGVFTDLDSSSWTAAAQGIMTTDTRPKMESTQVNINGSEVTITGIAKGSGMIKPNMATLLAFIFTDAKIEAPVLNALLRSATQRSFNRITVDGDTSTNDCCMLVATGSSEVAIESQEGEGKNDDNNSGTIAFAKALNEIFQKLATGLIRDAEGASKFITINVSGGATAAECLQVAYTVAESPLVKTAFFASDPNWGRILAAVGRAGISDLDLNAITIALGDTRIVSNGGVDADYNEAKGQAEMDEAEITVEINLARGENRETVWTSDLSHDYVRINSDYRS